jgi:hypothetical protein
MRQTRLAEPDSLRRDWQLGQARHPCLGCLGAARRCAPRDSLVQRRAPGHSSSHRRAAPDRRNPPRMQSPKPARSRHVCTWTLLATFRQTVRGGVAASWPRAVDQLTRRAVEQRNGRASRFPLVSPARGRDRRESRGVKRSREHPVHSKLCNPPLQSSEKSDHLAREFARVALLTAWSIWRGCWAWRALGRGARMLPSECAPQAR